MARSFTSKKSVIWFMSFSFMLSEHVIGCPLPCHCSDDLRIVNCENKDLTSIPLNIPQQVEELHLEGNNLTDFSQTSFNYTNLKRLYLNGNMLQNISSNILEPLYNLEMLDLSDNYVQSDIFSSIQGLKSLRDLNLGNNQIEDFNTEMIAGLDKLVSLNLQANELTLFNTKNISEEDQYIINNNSTTIHNTITDIKGNNNETYTKSQIQTLDLSNNRISETLQSSFITLPRLQNLNLSNNEIHHIDENSFLPLNSLKYLDISGNLLKTTPAQLFKNNVELEKLHISNMPVLVYLNHKTFANLSKLSILDLSYNTRLFYIHAYTFNMLSSLQILDIRNNSLTTLSENLLQNLTNLQTLMLNGNPWKCDCNLHWLVSKLNNGSNATYVIKHQEDIKCSQPEMLRGTAMVDTDFTNWTCVAAKVVNYTQNPLFKIGSTATLNCDVVGDPKPTIIWITPRKKTFIHSPHHIQFDQNRPDGDKYHTNHMWHEGTDYQPFTSVLHEERVHLLQNGSLFIDYVLRSDGGWYTCFTSNKYGNHSATMRFKLDYLILRKVRIFSILIGLCTAFVFFLIAIIIWVIRYVAHKCSREQRQKRKSIREIIVNLDAYKSVQLDKLRNYKNITVGTLLTQVEKMRENYVCQVTKIKDNCAQHMDRVRDNYSTHMGKFKDYRSHQIERIRENYHHQLVKTRDYGTMQIEKLREQYKLQQQHLLKLLEIMNLTNCRGVVEAECLRTESMLFDENLILGLNSLNLHELKENCSFSSAEYITASSNNSSTMSINQQENHSDEAVPKSHQEGGEDNYLARTLCTPQQQHNKSEESDTIDIISHHYSDYALNDIIIDDKVPVQCSVERTRDKNKQVCEQKNRTSTKADIHENQMQMTHNDAELEDIYCDIEIEV